MGQRRASELSQTEDCRLFDLSSQRTDTPSSLMTTMHIYRQHGRVSC